MKWIAPLLVMLAPAAAAGDVLECLSIDGQLRVDFDGSQPTGITIRAPADGAREARTIRMSPADVELTVLSESEPSVLVEGCAGEAKGTIAIVKTTRVTTRSVRLGFPGGGAFPAGIAGRTADGDAIERDLTCRRSTSRMAACP